MKNIFILPTDEASKLFIIDQSKMFISKPPYLSFSTVGGKVHKIEGVELYQPQFIYITNEEKIKDGNWCYDREPNPEDKNNIRDFIYKNEKDNRNTSTEKKIVLTNDPKLIADGVKELTEEQLKEIVSKYPLDYVEVKRVRKEYVDEQDAYGYDVDYYSLFFNSFSAKNKKYSDSYNKEDDELRSKILNAYLDKEVFSEEKMYTKEDLIGAFNAGNNQAELPTTSTSWLKDKFEEWFENK